MRKGKWMKMDNTAIREKKSLSKRIQKDAKGTQCSPRSFPSSVGDAVSGRPRPS